MAVCAHLLLSELARLTTVSKVWAETYKMRLSSDQQRLKALVADAPLDPSSPVPRQPLLSLLPTHLPPSPTPLVKGQGHWQSHTLMAFGDQVSAGAWQPDGCRTRSFCFRMPRADNMPRAESHLDGFRFGGYQFVKARHSCRVSQPEGRASDLYVVEARVGKPEDMPLLLVLLQDRLPRWLEDKRQQSGGPAATVLVQLHCKLSEAHAPCGRP